MNSKRLIFAAPASVLAVTFVLCFARQGRGQSDDLPGLSDQVVQARQQYESSLDQLVRLRASAMQQAHASHEYIDAANAVTDTYQVYQQDREQVIASLKANDLDYAKLAAQKQAVNSQLDAARLDPNTTVQRFNDLYNQKSATKKQLEAMQKAAMDKVGNGQHWQQWQTASRNFEALQTRLQAQVEASPEVARARDETDAAKNALASLDAQSESYFASSNTPPPPTQDTGTDAGNLVTNNGWGDYYGYPVYGGYVVGYGRDHHGPWDRHPGGGGGHPGGGGGGGHPGGGGGSGGGRRR